MKNRLSRGRKLDVPFTFVLFYNLCIFIDSDKFIPNKCVEMYSISLETFSRWGVESSFDRETIARILVKARRVRTCAHKNAFRSMDELKNHPYP